MDDELIIYTPKDLEKILQFKSTKINQLLKQQIIPAVKIGGQYRTSKKQLDDWFLRNMGKEFEIRD